MDVKKMVRAISIVYTDRAFLLTHLVMSGVVAILMVAIPFFITFHEAFMQSALSAQGGLLRSLPSYVLVQYPPGAALTFFLCIVVGLGHVSALQGYLYRYARAQQSAKHKHVHRGAWLAALLSAGCSACGVVAIGAFLNALGVGSFAFASAVSDIAQIVVLVMIGIGLVMSWRMVFRVTP